MYLNKMNKIPRQIKHPFSLQLVFNSFMYLWYKHYHFHFFLSV